MTLIGKTKTFETQRNRGSGGDRGSGKISPQRTRRNTEKDREIGKNKNLTADLRG
jgi:hypothetical protein